MDPMQVLQPNSMGDAVENKGVESIVSNLGWGVAELRANPGAELADSKEREEREETNPGMTKLRRAKAREFGKPMQDVGF